MIWALITLVGVLALILMGCISADAHLDGRAKKTPDLQTIEEVIKAYDKLRARHGDKMNKFISRAIAVQHEIDYARDKRNIRANKNGHKKAQ